MKDILERLEDILDEYKYTAHKVSHGRYKSKASKKTGTEKLKYKQSLKKAAKKRKNNPAMKTKAKRSLKKRKKTSQFKMTKKKYQQFKK